MDVAAIASLATEMTQSRIANAVQLTVMKKSLDIQEQNAMQLVAAAAQAIPTATNNPANLGATVDTFA